MDANFTGYEDIKEMFIIFHEFSHTHMIQEINSRYKYFEDDFKQINESHSDLTSLLSTAKYFDLDYLTFYQVANGLLNLRKEDAFKNKDDGHNTTKALEEILKITENEYYDLKKMEYSFIPFFSNEYVLNNGLNNYVATNNVNLLNKIKNFNTDQETANDFNQIMIELRHSISENNPKLYEDFNNDISNVLKTFRSLNSKSTFINFLQSDDAPEELKNNKIMDITIKDQSKFKIEFNKELKKLTEKIELEIVTKNENFLEIPESISLGVGADKVLTKLKEKYKIKKGP